MAIPEGYTKLGLVGYSDKGTYTAEATYNRYNVVLHNGSTYVALKDGLTGVEPSDDKVNWKYFARGFEAEMASEITAVDKYNIAGGTPDPTGASTTEVMLQLLLDKYSDQIVNKLVSNEGFQQKLMDYIINNGATNQEGYVADARQLNPEVEGSLAAQVSELYAKTTSQPASQGWYIAGHRLKSVIGTTASTAGGTVELPWPEGFTASNSFVLGFIVAGATDSYGDRVQIVLDTAAIRVYTNYEAMISKPITIYLLS